MNFDRNERGGENVPSLKIHLIVGALVYPFYTLGFWSISEWLGAKFRPTNFELSLAYLALVVGSDLPDLDSSNAPIRNFLKALLVGFGIYAMVPTVSELLVRIDVVRNLAAPVVTVISLAVSMLAAYLVVSLFLSLPLFAHRGFAHSLTFGALYGLLIYAFTLREVTNPLFLAVAGFAGVLVHLLTDYHREPWRALKFK